MKRDSIFRVAIPFLTATLFSITGCKHSDNKETNIIGEWKANWETKADESFSEIASENLRMEGIIKFNADGKVEISAFGYDGCIFSDDTLQHVLDWKLDDSVIRFIDKDDDHGLPYTINKFTSSEMHLTLLEDISLTLVRN